MSLASGDDPGSGWTDHCEQFVRILREISGEHESVKDAVDKIQDVDAYRLFEYEGGEVGPETEILLYP